MPLRRFANFIIERRVLVLIVLAAVCAVAALQIPAVRVVTDQSEYLEEDSSIRTGLEIIDEEFPELARENTIRVMFRNLLTNEKSDIERQLLRTPYVSSVISGDGEEYARNGYTLYVLTTDYAYNSPQQRDLMEGLEKNFQGYEMTVENDSADTAALSWWIPLGAVLCAAVILFFCLHTWIEPLFVLLCGILAVGLNSGTDIFLGRISQLAASLCPVLVMLFSITGALLLCVKWHREMKTVDDPDEAMIRALMSAFPVLAGALLAAAGAFLMLMFLRSGLAADFGLVTAKGVLSSCICVLFGMPCLIVLGSGKILRTQRPSPNPQGRTLSRFQFDNRRPLSFLFAGIAGVSVLLSFFMNPVFGITKEDAIAAQFPEENEITVVYQNGDENPASRLASTFSALPNVSGVSSYATTLGRQYTAEEMYAVLHESGSSMPLSLPLLQILYYDRFTDAQLPFITAGDLISFIDSRVEGTAGIEELLNPQTIELFARMAPFTDPEVLRTPQTVSQVTQTLGIDQETAVELFSQYFLIRDDSELTDLTVGEFLDYLLTAFTDDPLYAEELTPEEKARLEGLRTYADAQKAAQQVSASEAAAALGINAETMRDVYTAYFARQSSYSPEAMNIAALLDFLQGDAAANAHFSQLLPSGFADTAARAERMTSLTDINRQMSAAELASFLQLDTSAVREIVGIYHQTDTGLMTLPQFLSYLTSPDVFNSREMLSEFTTEQRVELPRLNAAVQAAVVGDPLSPDGISQITALPISIVDSVFEALSPDEETQVASMELPDFLTAVTSGAYQNAINENDMAALVRMRSVVELVPENSQYSAAQMAAVLNLQSSQTAAVYTLYSRTQAEDETMSPQEVIGFVLSDPDRRALVGSDGAALLESDRRFMDAAQSGPVSYDQAASLFGMEVQDAKLLYTYHDALTAAGAAWRIPLNDVADFITEADSPAAPMVSPADRERLSAITGILQAAADGKEFTPEEMASLTGINESLAQQVYRSYLVASGEVETWTIPLSDLIDFIATTGDTGYQGTGLEWIRQLSPLIHAVADGRQYSALGFYMLLASMGQDVSESAVELIYLYYAATHNSSSAWTMSPLQLINYLADDVLKQPAYSAYMDSTMQSRILELQQQIENAAQRLKGENYSIMTVRTPLPLDSPQMRELFDTVTTDLTDTLAGTYYLTGNIPVSYEMSQDFPLKFILLMLLTDLCAFAGCCVAMRSFLVPLVMTLLAQVCIWFTGGILGSITGNYYLTLLIAQCFCVSQTAVFAMSTGEDYRLNRRTLDIEESLRSFYQDGTVMIAITSGLAMTAAFVFLWCAAPETSPGHIARLPVFSIICAAAFVILLLPALLACLDNWVRAKSLSVVELEQKERPGGHWEGKRLLDKAALAELKKGTFVPAADETASGEEEDRPGDGKEEKPGPETEKES